MHLKYSVGLFRVVGKCSGKITQNFLVLNKAKRKKDLQTFLEDHRWNFDELIINIVQFLSAKCIESFQQATNLFI